MDIPATRSQCLNYYHISHKPAETVQQETSAAIQKFALPTASSCFPLLQYTQPVLILQTLYPLRPVHLIRICLLQLGRGRLKIQIRKPNKVSSYLINHTVSKYNRKLLLVSMVNTSGLVNNTRNRETGFPAGFMVSDFSFRVIKSMPWFRLIRRRIRHSNF